MLSCLGLLSASIALAPPPTIDSVVRVKGANELEIKLRADYRNPFDPAEVALDARVYPPVGKPYRLPGFFYQAYKRNVGRRTFPIAYSSTDNLTAGRTQTSNEAEIVLPVGKPSWRVRLHPQQTGRYRIELTVRDRNGTAVKTTWLEAKAAGKGMVNAVGNRFAVDGASFFPIGANLCWAGPKGTFDYDEWLPEYAKAGANWARLWLSPHWTTFSLETPETGLGRFDLSNAWKLDRVMTQCESMGIRLNLCIDSYNVLRDRVSWPEWERSPHNRANGGPLSKPTDFWTSPTMDRLYRNKLRYLIARYGASPAVFAWEFWNEVDGTTDYRIDPILAWHRRMASYLHANDPYRHLVTTSFGGNGEGAGDARLFALKELDFAQSHLYEAPDLARAVVDANHRLGVLGKPHFVAEIGADTGGPRDADDPQGLQIHDPLWASICGGAAGGAMPWWWDSYVHPKRLYPIFAAATRFLKGVDLGSMRPVQVITRYQDPPLELPREDIVFSNGPVLFTPSPFNKPTTIDLNGPLPTVTGILHGLGNHPELHNPVTFITNFDRETALTVQVGDVSGYGGANLRVEIDGRRMLDKEFVDDDPTAPSLRQYAGPYTVMVPAGRHRVTVRNDGKDWVHVGFRFAKGLMVRSPLVGWAMSGPKGAVVWLRVRGRTWQRVCAQKDPPQAAPPAVVTLPALQGRYRVERWDTWHGVVTGESVATVRSDGNLTLRLPATPTDTAIRVRRLR